MGSRGSSIREAIIKIVGGAAGATVEPQQGLQRLREKAKSPLVTGVGLGLAAGYLYGRRAAKH